MTDWISVNDNLPEPKTFCLVWTGSGHEICYFTPNSKWSLTALYGIPVTHWMPMPEPPK